MRLTAALPLSIAILFSVATTTASPKPPTGNCDLKARGPSLLARQDAAIKDFAEIFLGQRDPRKAFDKYVPGQYIEHNPNGLSGRENAISFLEVFINTPGLTVTNLTAYAGGGFGHMHFREFVKGDFDQVIMDKLRFEGTCFVEHWDVAQAVTGEELNPEAWF